VARKAQTTYWRYYCSGINKNITRKELWQKVKVMKKENRTQGVSTLIHRGGKLISLLEYDPLPSDEIRKKNEDD
jgi:hypothetical protein